MRIRVPGRRPVVWFALAALLAVVTTLIGLIVLGLVWELWLAPTGRGTLALKVLPLCIPLAGLLKSRMYTYRWVSLMIWLYFTEGVVRAWGDKGWSSGLALAQTILCVILFAACALHVRWRFQMARAGVSLDDSQESKPSH